MMLIAIYLFFIMQTNEKRATSLRLKIRVLLHSARACGRLAAPSLELTANATTSASSGVFYLCHLCPILERTRNKNASIRQKK